jgi:class 3 adenylate cyclase
MANISIKSKLLIMLLSVSALSIAAVATLSYRASYQALEEGVYSHLTSVRASKADALERYVGTMLNEIGVLATSSNVGLMTRTFSEAVAELENIELTPEQTAELEAWYRSDYLPPLDVMVEGTPEFLSLFPETNAARYLQYHYIAKNPYPRDTRVQLDDAADGSAYTAFHQETHPQLRRIALGFGYYDLFLIDITSGVVVYSTAKEVDLGTSLVRGPHAMSNLARLFREVQRNPDRGAARIIDFEHYRPSYGEPAMFIAAPVYHEGRPVGVIAAQESTAELDRVMTGGGQWERDGLGRTGETVLLGPDYTMRSASRLLIENPEGYAELLRAIGISEEKIERIVKLGSPILEQEARNYATEQALRGQSGTGVVTAALGQEILGSWAPLKLNDLNWVIAGKMDVDEAYAPIYDLAKGMLIQTVIILVVITIVVMLLATSFVRPVNDLIARVQRFGAGDQEVDFDGTGKDEIGDLSLSFRELVESARKQTSLIEEVSKENERLLGNILPRRFAQQVQHGSSELRETIPEVSVIFAEIRGLANITQDRSAHDCVAILKEFLAAADEASQSHNAERIKTMGDTYMAAVGLSSPLLDHMSRAVEFARDLRSAVERIAQIENADLQLMVGISAGPVITNVVHEDDLLFHLWGEAVINADHARDQASLGQIVVTDDVKEALVNKYSFSEVSAPGPLSLWALADD